MHGTSHPAQIQVVQNASHSLVVVGEGSMHDRSRVGVSKIINTHDKGQSKLQRCKY